MNNKIFDVLILGSGLSSMIFAEEYLKKNKKINIISPSFDKDIHDKFLFKPDDKGLPPQFKKNFSKIEDYFKFNNFKFDKKNCSLLGSLEFGGISNYWGLQIDKDFSSDLNSFGHKAKKEIIKSFLEMLNEKSLTGSFKNYKKDFKLNYFYEKLLGQTNKKNDNLIVEKSLLALNKIDNKKKVKKLTPNLIFDKIKNKIIMHNYFVEKIKKKKNLLYLHSVNKNDSKIFVTKKLILAAGTLSTTRLIMEYLGIKNEVSIKHHPRLISVYLGRNRISSNLDIAPGLFQIKNKKENFSGDIRPSNEMIINMALKIYSIFKPIKNILMLFKN